MPFSGHFKSPLERNPKLWYRCRDTISKEMISQGWSKHAGKFDGVLQKRALRLFNNS